MVSPKLKGLEQVQRAVEQSDAKRSGMIGRGRVKSVNLLSATAVVERYGRNGQIARLDNVGIIGFPEASEIAKLRGEDVILLFPSGKAGAGEAWILGVVSRPTVLYDSLVARVGGSTEIVDAQRVIDRHRDAVEIVSDMDTDTRQVTIVGLELAADSVKDATMQATIGGVVYRSFTIDNDARGATSGPSVGSEAPLTVLAAVGTPWHIEIAANASIPVTVGISAVRSDGVSIGSYRVLTGAGAASDRIFSPQDPTKDEPLVRIRGQVVTL